MSNEPIESIHNYLRLSDRIGTAGQPTLEQFSAIQQAGFQVIVNLLPPDRVLEGEADRVISLGMEYLSIPVWWDSPERYDLECFFEAMKANAQKRVFVHCAANMRVSTFMYLYRVLCEGVPAEAAECDLHRIWIPNPLWQRFMTKTISTFREVTS